MELREEAWSPGPLDSEDQQMASHENPGERPEAFPADPAASHLTLASFASGWEETPLPCFPLLRPWDHPTLASPPALGLALLAVEGGLVLWLQVSFLLDDLGDPWGPPSLPDFLCPCPSSLGSTPVC
ncbi:ZNF787 isoform 3 [Pan troglodytes]|uniref:ZNF787 isoform 3 n=2 Tax=Pan troglodytes TaxID=9598 RepID=A0A6D2Y0C6_PANTR|nr:ZNF787 isoform 3 [Pan troglodytes]